MSSSPPRSSTPPPRYRCWTHSTAGCGSGTASSTSCASRRRPPEEHPCLGGPGWKTEVGPRSETEVTAGSEAEVAQARVVVRPPPGCRPVEPPLPLLDLQVVDAGMPGDHEAE